MVSVAIESAAGVCHSWTDSSRPISVQLGGHIQPLLLTLHQGHQRRWLYVSDVFVVESLGGADAAQETQRELALVPLRSPLCFTL